MTETLPAPIDSPSLWDGVLDDRELKFVLAYVGKAHFNATRAAEMAGYPKRSAHVRGCELKKRKHVRARINAYLAEEGLDDAEWFHHVTDVARRALNEYVHIDKYDRDGNPVGAVMDASAKMKALELYGKATGKFTEKVQVDVRSVEVKLNGVDLERFTSNVVEAAGSPVERTNDDER